MVKEEVTVDDGGIAIEHGGEELVAVGHHAAVVAGRVLGDRDLGVGGDEVRVAGCIEQVIEAGEHFISWSFLEEETTPDAAFDGL